MSPKGCGTGKVSGSHLVRQATFLLIRWQQGPGANAQVAASGWFHPVQRTAASGKGPGGARASSLGKACGLTPNGSGTREPAGRLRCPHSEPSAGSRGNERGQRRAPSAWRAPVTECECERMVPSADPPDPAPAIPTPRAEEPAPALDAAAVEVLPAPAVLQRTRLRYAGLALVLPILQKFFTPELRRSW